ncbi:hypothetical protein NSA60_14330 [Pseudomonas oleovorans]|uniref:Uncharacterized protein n=1 Tax=Ectopseudomonas oleovorans TaxID=301 RepID=A0AB35L099_ECTOL|nr:hypothetical protein [Pseudomonas oleovorans]MCR1827859.1 hypothetical protein [Pseudomonas oleovorans]MDH0568449.1 hypothetical protein [Pseudomonas oleovorans]
MDYEADLPNLDHWKSVMEFTVEQAALLLAMIDPFDVETLAEAKDQRLPRWKMARAHCLAITSAIRQGLISPVVCCAWVWPEGCPEPIAVNIKPSDRDRNISPTHTIITRAALTNWIESERVQFTKPSKSIKPAIPPAVSVTTIEATPVVALPYHGHTSEGLEFVEDAIKQLWSTYDPEQPSTAPTQEEVINYLKSRGGAGVNMAQAVNLVLRPGKLRQGGRRVKQVITSKE